MAQYITPIEWCMTVRQLRRELTRFHRLLRDMPQDAIIYYNDYLAHMSRPLQKCEFSAALWEGNQVFVNRRGREKMPKLSKKRIRHYMEENRRLEEAYKAERDKGEELMKEFEAL